MSCNVEKFSWNPPMKELVDVKRSVQYLDSLSQVLTGGGVAG